MVNGDLSTVLVSAAVPRGWDADRPDTALPVMPARGHITGQIHDLLETLRGWELVQAADQEAEVLSALLESLVQAGEWDPARTWWRWAVRHLAEVVTAEARVHLEAGLVRTAGWLGMPDRVDMLAAALSGPVTETARCAGEAALAERALARGDTVVAERVARAWWAALRTREEVVRGADLYVRVLRAAGQPGEAQAEGRAALHLSAGLPEAEQVQARLACVLAHLTDTPGPAAAELTALGEHARASGSVRWQVRLAVYRAVALQAAGRALDASRVLRGVHADPRLAPLLGLSSAEGQWWAAQQAARDAPAALRDADVTLSFLGTPELRVRGCRVRLRSRFADLLVALALRPDGLTGEELTLNVYGETGTANCCKTELSRLRQLVAVETRPYRVTASLQADFLMFPQVLAHGLSAEALALYRGPLLRTSDAPVVREQREYLHELLRQAVLASMDADLAWQAAGHFPDDREVWETLAGSLGRQDPRRSAAAARLEVLCRADV